MHAIAGLSEPQQTLFLLLMVEYGAVALIILTLSVSVRLVLRRSRPRPRDERGPGQWSPPIQR